MPTGLQTGHSGAFQEAIKNSLESCVAPALLTSTTALGTPPAGSFYSTIRNRAALSNPAGDLKVSMGIERIHIRQGYEVDGESGPQNEKVWGLEDDSRIRLIGDWQFESNSRDYHARSTGSVQAPCYIEITFYGTGINLLVQQDTSRSGLKYSVDSYGYAPSWVELWPTGTLSATTRERNYALNQTLKVVSGLALGLHTIVIKSENTHYFWGVEILNQQASNLVVAPGAAYINGLKTTYAGGNLSYSNGVTGTKGGRQLIYLRSNKTIGSAWQATDSTRYLTNADHSKEEIVRTHGIREFGANRADDFSTLSSTSGNRAFTLNDGTTTLQAVGGSISIGGGTAPEGLVLGANGTITFTFIGTGLDIAYYKANSAAAMDTHTITIDGVSVGSVPDTGAVFSVQNVMRIASGLPYGTHQVQITRTTAVSLGCWFVSFITYQPKKPTLPNDCIELAESCILANFSGTASTGINSISAGVIRKAVLREPVYYGTGWSLIQNQSATLSVNSVAGYTVDTATTNDYMEYTFWGTGIEVRFYQANAASFTDYTIDGYSDFTTMPNGNGGTGIVTAFGGGTTGSSLSWSASTGRMTGDSGTVNYRGCYLRFTNLELGLHTIRITRKTAHSLSLESLDVITPMYMPVSDAVYRTPASLMVGNNSLGDLRNFDFLTKKESIVNQQRTGKLINSWFIQTSAGSRQTITSTSPVVISGLSVTLVPSSANSKFFISAVVNGSMTHVCSTVIYRNGSNVLPSSGTNSNEPGSAVTTYVGTSSADYMMQHVINYMDAPGTTSSITYDLRMTSGWAGSAYATYINNRASNDMAAPSFMFIMEFES